MSEEIDRPEPKADSTWEKCKFMILHIRSITIAGLIGWFIIVMSMELLGLISIETDCGVCNRVIDKVLEKFVSNASAAPIDRVPDVDPIPPVRVRITFLPVDLTSRGDIDQVDLTSR